MVSKRFVKKQQMRWTQRGAHLLLQTRVQVLNDELRETFCRWFPGMKSEEQGALKSGIEAQSPEWTTLLLAVGAMLTGTKSGAYGQEVGVEVKPVRTEKLANAPGMTFTVVKVTNAPGGKSGQHHHAGMCLPM